MSNFTMSHAAPDHELQKMFHCQIQALSLQFFSRKPPYMRVGLVANRQECLSLLMIIFSHILQFQLVYRFWHWLSAPSWVLSRTSHRTAGTGDTLLMNWQQPCKSPTTHAGVQAISICGWSKICSDVYGSGDVHVVVPTNAKLKVISLTILIFNAKINTTHVALNISSKAGSWRNATILVLQG